MLAVSKNILFVHQSAELYGSDRVLLNVVFGLKERGYVPIVVLPNQGPLELRLRQAGIEVHIGPVGKISRRIRFLESSVLAPFWALKIIRAMDRIVSGRGIRLVHSNTLAVIGGALWANARNVPHLWHVHEIVMHPAVARKGFPILLRFLADHVICNSKATRDWLVGEQPKLVGKSEVVWNGVRPAEAEALSDRAEALRRRLGLGKEQILLTLVGRINSWKGHGLLLAALERLSVQGGLRPHLLFIGDTPPGQADLREKLIHTIAHSSVASSVSLLEFSDRIADVWEATDIAVVPSTEPEPFGLVAIEAMAAGKPVVAARHGGLREIVVDGETGILAQPNDVSSLEEGLAKLIRNPELRRWMGENGRARHRALFSVEAQIDHLCACYARMGA